jgi:hypothetical protein
MIGRKKLAAGYCRRQAAVLFERKRILEDVRIKHGQITDLDGLNGLKSLSIRGVRSIRAYPCLIA